MKIRTMSPDDIPLLAEIVRQNYNQQCAEAFYHEAACAFYNYPFKPRFLTAEVNDRVLGCCCWNADWCSWGIYNLSWVQVSPKYQRQGIGRQLVDAALRELRPISTLILLSTTKPEYYAKHWNFQDLKKYKVSNNYELNYDEETLMGLSL